MFTVITSYVIIDYIVNHKREGIFMSKKFETTYGDYAVVTGASDGIGRAIAIEIAKRGVNVILVARRQKQLEDLRTQILKTYKVSVEILPLDLSKPESSKTLFHYVDQFDVGLYAGVAGFGTSGDFVEGPIDEELEMIDVNCRAVVEQSFYFANRLRWRGRGGMILMSSLVAFQGVPRASCYSATKAFIQSFAEGLHRELQPFGVHVLSVAPGPVESGFARRAKMQMSKAETPEGIAGEIVDALGKKMMIRPGFLSKFLGWSLLTMTRWQRVKVMGKIMAGMTRRSIL